MLKQTELIDKVLRIFDEEGLLNHLIVIGSWCIHFYKHGFPEGHLLPPLRTTDIEFDVSSLNRAPRKVDIPAVLNSLDFIVDFKGDGCITLVHSEITLEFLVPEKGRGESEPRKFPGFGINAAALRYLSLLEDEVVVIDYKGLKVRVPHPLNFALHKLIISERRTKAYKAKNDMVQGVAVWDMVVSMGLESRIRETFEQLKPKWKGHIRNALLKAGAIDRIAP